MNPVLQWALPVALTMLVLAMGCALARVLKGPSAQDRVLALDCMALNGMLCCWRCSALWGPWPWPSFCCAAR